MIGVREGATQRRRSAVGAVLTGAAALSLCGCGASSNAANVSSATPLFGSFAGYIHTGPVRSVAADFIVPPIQSDSPPGNASTWIAAQAPVNPKTAVGPFVQVGVTETRVVTRTGKAGNFYFAFWSGTAVGFHPKTMFRVQPGDAIKVSIEAAGHRWILAAQDARSGITRSVSAGRPVSPAANEAVWTQEDPTSLKTAAPVPYPQLSGPAFTHLKVDGAAPASASLSSGWLSTPNAIYGPKLTRTDGFAIVAEHPTASAIRYQELASREDLSADKFSAEFASWTPQTSRRVIDMSCRAFAQELAANLASLRAQSWPTAVEPLMRQLISTTESARRIILHLESESVSAALRLRDAPAPRQNSNVVSRRIRTALGLPTQTSLSGLLLAKATGHSVS